jgi:cobalt-zinc-cadmium efflux system outer membrane protein
VKHYYGFAPIVLALSIVSSSGCWGQAPPPSILPSNAPVPPPPASLSVEQAVAEALVDNPQIRAAVRRLSLAQMKTGTARSLDDPMLMVRDWQTPLRKPWDLNQAQLMFSLQQTFPGKQKLDLRAKVSDDDAQAASDDLETLRQDVSASVREACSALLRNADEMRVHNQQATVLNQAISAALAEYTAGKAPQSDVLRAQMTLTRLNEHLIELEAERDAARAELSVLLGHSPDAPIEIAGAYRVPAALPSTEELERIAIEHRPELASLRKQITRSEDQSQLARLALKPDLTLAAGYMLMPTGSSFRNAYMAELTMPLPSLNRGRHDGEAKQADAATDVVRADLDARTSAVFLEIRQAQIALHSAQSRIKLYRDTLLPQAEANFSASASAYENNRGEFTNLIDSQNLLLDIRTAYYQALAAADASGAQLERSIGMPIPTTPTTDSTPERTTK